MPKEQRGNFLVINVEVLRNQERNFSEYQPALVALYKAIAAGNGTEIRRQHAELEKAHNKCISLSPSVETYSSGASADPNTHQIIIELAQPVSSLTSAVEILTNLSLAKKNVSLHSGVTHLSHSFENVPVTQTITGPEKSPGLSTKQPQPSKNVQNLQKNPPHVQPKVDNTQKLEKLTAKITSWIETYKELTAYSDVLTLEQQNNISGFINDLKDFSKKKDYNLSTAERLYVYVIDTYHAAYDEIEQKLNKAIDEQANWIALHVNEENAKAWPETTAKKCRDLLDQAEQIKQLTLEAKKQLRHDLAAFNQQIYPLLNTSSNKPPHQDVQNVQTEKPQLNQEAVKKSEVKPTSAPVETKVNPTSTNPTPVNGRTKVRTNSNPSIRVIEDSAKEPEAKPGIFGRIGQWISAKLTAVKNWVVERVAKPAPVSKQPEAGITERNYPIFQSNQSGATTQSSPVYQSKGLFVHNKTSVTGSHTLSHSVTVTRSETKPGLQL